MKKHILFSLVAIILAITNCTKPEEGGKDNPQPPTPSQEQITIPSTVDVTPVVPPEGGDAKITFTAAAAWTASVISTKADFWVDVKPKSGDPGPAEIKITAAPNDTYVERNATIQIKCGTETKDVVLTQKQVDNITVTTDKVELGAEGGTFTIELKSNIDFSYEIKGDWIKYVSTKSYSDKTLTFSAEPNDGVRKREGSVTVKGGEFSETIKVYQSGEEPTLVISQNEYNLEADGGSITVEVSSNVAVTMTIPEDAGWITENQTKSVSTSTFHLDIAANKEKEERSAEITFSNEESGLSEKVTVNQKGEIYVPVTDMVDLGLSVKWATCNVGASKPEEYGGYYQWAGIQDVSSTSIYLDWSNCPYHTGSDKNTGWTKYDYSVDCKTVLDPEDDIAYTTLGGKWRIPTTDEWWELIDNCKWTWTTQNGVPGYKFTGTKSGYTDKSIFLPVTRGYRSGGEKYDDGPYGYYWSSSLNTGESLSALYVGFDLHNLYGFANYRYSGKSVRPVYGDKVRVAGVSLNPTSLELNIGESSILSAMVTPSNAAEYGVSWTSSDTSVATVDWKGKVTARKVGSATITVTTTDGGHTATCSVTVPEPAVPEMVDLGLSVMWASFNVGAAKPEEYGGYYQWAGLEDVTSSGIYLAFNNCPYHTGSNEETGWTKYIPFNQSSYWSGPGSPDNKTVLDSVDDIAYVTLGGEWRMPTFKEWEELMNNCKLTWTKLNGVDGYKVTGKKSGYTDKWIFLPAAGYRSGMGLYDAGSRCAYWSSVLNVSDPSCAYHILFLSDVLGTGYDNRYSGKSVRPVYIGKVNVTGVSLNPASLNLNVGETSTLSAVITPSNATDKSVSWTSKNKAVATVDKSGKVTAVGAGSATITVKTTDGGHTATCNITVKIGSNIEDPEDGDDWEWDNPEKQR